MITGMRCCECWCLSFAVVSIVMQTQCMRCVNTHNDDLLGPNVNATLSLGMDCLDEHCSASIDCNQHQSKELPCNHFLLAFQLLTLLLQDFA